MNSKEFKEIIKKELEAADNKIEILRLQYKELGKDIEYWEEQVQALRIVNARLVFGGLVDEQN